MEVSQFLQIAIGIIFLWGFIWMFLEEKLHRDKAKPILFAGTLWWLVLYFGSADYHHTTELFEKHFFEIAQLFFFLMAAMSMVLMMEEKAIFEKLMIKFLPKRVNEKYLVLYLTLFTFTASGFTDNLTATLIVITMAAMLLKDKVRAAISRVFAANAWWVAMITWDPTTLMIFHSHKATLVDLLWLYPGALIATLFLWWLLYKNRNNHQISIPHPKEHLLKPHDRGYIIIFLATIAGIFLGHLFFHIPPVIIFLFGMSIMQLYVRGIGKRKKDKKNLRHILEKLEWNALLFFVGVLLLVGAVKEVGLLDYLAQSVQYLNEWQKHLFVIFAWAFSAVIDNIPLTATFISADLPIKEIDRLLLTYAVGVGWSLLFVGSAAGVIALSKVPGLQISDGFKYIHAVFWAYVLGYLISLGILSVVLH